MLQLASHQMFIMFEAEIVSQRLFLIAAASPEYVRHTLSAGSPLGLHWVSTGSLLGLYWVSSVSGVFSNGQDLEHLQRTDIFHWHVLLSPANRFHWSEFECEAMEMACLICLCKHLVIMDILYGGKAGREAVLSPDIVKIH